MAWEDRMRAAWKAARKWAFRVATAWEEVRLRLAREEEVAKMESIKCQMVAGPMPPKVVMTHGRKRRPRAAEPEACLAVFSAARAVMMAWASRAAAVA
jgi:hypothetical protein